MKTILLILAVLASVASPVFGALTLVSHEPFVGPGTLTSGSPGSNFSSVTGTITLERVGARPSTVPAPGWSGEVRNTAGTSINYVGLFNFTADSNPRMIGAWFRFKSYPPSGNNCWVYQLYNGNGTENDIGVSAAGLIVFGISGVLQTTSTYTVPLNTWVYIGYAWQYIGSNNFKYEVGAQILGASFNGSVLSSASTPNYSSTLNSIAVGYYSVSGSAFRMSCPSVYTMGSYTTDFTYPSDIIAPVESRYNWYLNPNTGSDSNDGSTPSTAWATVTKASAESTYCGMLDSTAVGAGAGNVLTIDTSGGPLIPGVNTLTFSTLGLRVQPASGQQYIKFQAYEPLTNSAFALTSGLTKTYQTSDTQALQSGVGIYCWENDTGVALQDLWMLNVYATSFTATSCAVLNPTTGVSTPYSGAGCVGAALDATPGCFFTDGTNLYIHPFGNTNPTTDGKAYFRSIIRASAGPVVSVSGGNYSLNGLYVTKTTLVDNSGSLASYTINASNSPIVDNVLSGSGWTNEMVGCFTWGFDKHAYLCAGATTGTALLMDSDTAEQGNVYAPGGGEDPFVSYGGSDNSLTSTHYYRNCTCLASQGVIGSFSGSNNQLTFYSHNNNTSPTWSALTIDACNWAAINVSNSQQVNIINGTKFSQLSLDGKFNFIKGCTQNSASSINPTLCTLAADVVYTEISNCLFKPTWTLAGAPTFYGIGVTGALKVKNCTFDMSGVTGNATSYFTSGLIYKTTPGASVGVTFQNNVVNVTGSQNMPLLYGFAANDGLVFSTNVYELQGGTTSAPLARAFTDSTGTSDRAFAAWQTLGYDASSVFTSNMLLAPTTSFPLQGSPTTGVGVQLGSLPDLTGTIYATRNTAGCYQLPPNYSSLRY